MPVDAVAPSAAVNATCACPLIYRSISCVSVSLSVLVQISVRLVGVWYE